MKPDAMKNIQMKNASKIRTAAVCTAVVALPLLLAACGGGRWAGFDNCSADGSVVLIEYPNEQGNYDTLNNGPCKSAR